MLYEVITDALALAARLAPVQLQEVVALDQYLAFVRFDEADDEAGEGGLAGAGLADDADGLAAPGTFYRSANDPS